MNATVKTETVVNKTVTLTLSEENAQLLAGLVDFPLHSRQTENIRAFLRELRATLETAKVHGSASGAGFVPITSVAAPYRF